MRGGGGTLGACLAEVKGNGGDGWDKQLRSLKKRTQKGSPCPAETPSWMSQPTVDGNGNSPDEALSLEMKNDLTDTDLLLHNGCKVLLYLKKSVGRNLAPVVAPSKAMDLFSALEEEHLTGVSLSLREALGRDWSGRGSRAMGDHRGQCPRREAGVSGQPGHPKLWEKSIFKDEPPSALPERPGSELELFCLPSALPAKPHTCPAVLVDQTKCVFLDRLKFPISEHTTGYKKILSSVKSTSNGLQITPGLLALQPSELANPLCHG